MGTGMLWSTLLVGFNIIGCGTYPLSFGFDLHKVDHTIKKKQKKKKKTKKKKNKTKKKKQKKTKKKKKKKTFT